MPSNGLFAVVIGDVHNMARFFVKLGWVVMVMA